MPSLSESERQQLLQLARNAIVEAVAHHKLLDSIPHEGIFGDNRGVFVTIHVNGNLHGCIGTTEATEPLGDAIVRCGASAALQDPRFPQMQPEELSGLEVEVSVLSPLVPIRPENIEIGKHGLMVVDAGHRGLLLPQVAVEHGLSKEEFLAETCKKAHLSRDAWRLPGTTILGFTCDVFAEHTRALRSGPSQ
jgi:AmmeMemoRadiSam system protein A